MMQADLSRRSFLRGNIRGALPVSFPPWSVSDFTDKCERCDDCITACDEKILLKGDSGFPQIDFNLGECTFCRNCVDACQHNALDQSRDRAWAIKAFIGNDCLALNTVVCRSCGDSCDQRAIEFRLKTGGRALPVISHSLCNGCGACFSVCPTKAIQMKEAA